MLLTDRTLGYIRALHDNEITTELTFETDGRVLIRIQAGTVESLLPIAQTLWADPCSSPLIYKGEGCFFLEEGSRSPEDALSVIRDAALVVDDSADRSITMGGATVAFSDGETWTASTKSIVEGLKRAINEPLETLVDRGSEPTAEVPRWRSVEKDGYPKESGTYWTWGRKYGLNADRYSRGWGVFSCKEATHWTEHTIDDDRPEQPCNV